MNIGRKVVSEFENGHGGGVVGQAGYVVGLGLLCVASLALWPLMAALNGVKKLVRPRKKPAA